MKIEELRIGMVVEEFMPISQKYTPPMKVTGIFKGATDDTDWAYLEFEEHEGDPFEAHPKYLREVKK